jgi:hypothetical protein
VTLSDQLFDDILKAEVKDSGGKHPNLFIELQRKSEPTLLEGTICGTGFGQRESCQRELGEMAGRINRFLADEAAPELKIQVAEDSSGAVTFCGVALLVAVVMVFLGLRARSRGRAAAAGRSDGPE